MDCESDNDFTSTVDCANLFTYFNVNNDAKLKRKKSAPCITKSKSTPKKKQSKEEHKNDGAKIKKTEPTQIITDNEPPIKKICLHSIDQNIEEPFTIGGVIIVATSNLKSPTVGKGFVNIGNTCYMNAILQCLLNIDLFTNDLLYTRKQLCGNLAHNCLHSCLCELFQVRHSNDDLVEEALKKVKNSISRQSSLFSDHHQHDAHEFLCQVLDQLKEDVMITTTTTEPLPLIDGKITNTIAIVENPVVTNFEFRVKNTIHCQQCHDIIVKEEEYNNLCLDIPTLNSHLNRRYSIQDALDTFFRDENVPFKCEKCRNVEAIIKHRVVRLPRILVLYIKRYEFDSGNILIKNHLSVDIPCFLTFNKLDANDLKNPHKPFIKSSHYVPTPLMTRDLNQERSLSSANECKLASIIPSTPSLSSKVSSNSYLNNNKSSFQEVSQARSEITKLNNNNKPKKSKSGPFVVTSDFTSTDFKPVTPYMAQRYRSENRVTNGKKEKQENNGYLKTSSSKDHQRNIYENKHAEKQPHTYRLIGIASHLGASSNSGHYISDVMDLKTETWASFNDENKILELKESELLNKRSTTAYLLFYLNKSFIERID